MTGSERHPLRHSATTRALHWATAAAVIAAWLVGATMEEFPRGAARAAAKDMHYSLGLVVLGLAVMRVLHRAFARGARAGAADLRRAMASAMHVALVLLTIALPLSGLLDRWARGRPVSVFGGVILDPLFAVPGGKLWGELHEALAYTLLLAVAAHVLAALWHELVLRDGTLRSMLPSLRRAGSARVDGAASL